jgi:V8-like Glu-specific endopeptidase
MSDFVHPISRSTHLIKCYFKDNGSEEGKYLGSATGFSWKYGNQIYLITNWHVVSSKDSINGKNLSDKAALPNYIKIYGYDNSGKLQIIEKCLYESNEIDHDKKGWIEYRRLENGSMVDVVAIPLEPESDIELHPLNLINSFDSEIDLEIMMNVNIVGYPLENIKGNPWPIWMAGNIASEPKINFNEESLLLVNSITYKGMSGSPVIWIYHNRPIKKKKGGCMVNSVMGDFMTFVGIYSGRVIDKNIDDDKSGIVALSRVWKYDVIDQLFLSNN